jgi:hypothetical protein
MNNMYDQYGCCNSCGYVYCQILDACIRLWEIDCSSHRRLTKLADFTIDQLMLFIVGVLGALGALMLTLQKSKCQSCCWGCIKRDVDAVIAEERLQATGHTGTTPRDNENDLDINIEK